MCRAWHEAWIRIAHVFKALVVSDDSKCPTEVSEALADAGCVDIEVATLEVAFTAQLAVDLVIVDLARANIACVARLAKQHDVPVVALCEERYIDGALRAGAAECVTTPVRTREL